MIEMLGSALTVISLYEMNFMTLNYLIASQSILHSGVFFLMEKFHSKDSGLVGIRKGE